MKNIISWASALTIVAAITLTALGCGAYVASCVSRWLGVTGLWCLTLIPVVLVVSLAVAMFFLAGLRKFEANN